MKLQEFSFIDIHAHVNFPDYDPDREEVIKRANDKGVAMINVGTDALTSGQVVDLAKTHEGMYAIVGLHPNHPTEDFADYSVYDELAKDSKVVAIGECGLDQFWSDESALSKQKEVFEAMIKVANNVSKPLMLHIRNPKNGRTSTYRQAYEILKANAKTKGDLHFFAGDLEEAKLFLDLGYSFSFTGVITFARNYDEVIKYLPLERIMTETDCPFVAPRPYRGQRNEPVYVIEVIKALADIRGLNEEAVARQVMTNAKQFFSLS